MKTLIKTSREGVRKLWNRTSKGAKQSIVVVGSVGILSLLALNGCKKNALDSGDFNKSATAGALALTCADTMSVPVNSNGIITIDTLTSNKLWKLNGVSYVDANQTLVIEPGTTIITGATKNYNDPAFGNQTIAGVLVVAKGGKLIANGMANAPIVFTSASAGGCGSGCSRAGAFGGIVILGDAPTNQPTTTRIEGVPAPAGTDITYGGSNASHNGGSLQYVRIEFPGYRLAANNEINGLTLGGVGSGTTLSHIQVSYSADDAFEFFGGTVNADHLVAIGTDDDDFDFDFGYVGGIDYAVGLKDPNSTHSKSGTQSDCNGIESDNEGTSPYTSGPPYTKPVLRHFTLLGFANNTIKPDTLLNGNRWRRKSSLDIQYSVIGGYPTGARFDNFPPNNPISDFSDNVVHAYTTLFNPAGPPTTVNSPNFTSTASTANNYLQLGAGTSSSFFTCGTTFNPANLIPTEDSPAYGSGTASTFKGAFQPDVAVWTAGWTNFNPGFCCN